MIRVKGRARGLAHVWVPTRSYIGFRLKDTPRIVSDEGVQAQSSEAAAAAAEEEL